MTSALLILGMHRSGTSALARVVNLLGVSLGGNLMAGGEDNPRGFWEQEDIVVLHEQLLRQLGSLWHATAPLFDDWQQDPAVSDAQERLRGILDRQFSDQPLWGIKDPRLSLLMPCWEPVLHGRQTDIHCLIALRPPMEVAASITARDGYPTAHGLAAWMHYTLMAEYHSRAHPRAVIPYDALLQDWQATMSKAATRTGLDWPIAPDAAAGEIDAFLTPGLRHHAATEDNSRDNTGDNSPMPEQVARLYGLMQEAAETGHFDTDAFDHLRLRCQEETAGHSSCLQAGLTSIEAERRLARDEIAQLTRELEKVRHAFKQAQQQIHDTEQARDATEQSLQETRQTLEEIRHSFWWKCSQPLRALARRGKNG